MTVIIFSGFLSSVSILASILIDLLEFRKQQKKTWILVNYTNSLNALIFLEKPTPCFVFYDRFPIISASSINSKESGMPQFGGRPDTGDISDERIQHILTEASSMIAKPSPQQQQQQNHHQLSTPNTPLSSAMKHMQMEDSHSIEDSKSPPNCTSPFGKRNMKKYENDDISEEKLQKIYQEEFTKLMSRGQRDAFPK